MLLDKYKHDEYGTTKRYNHDECPEQGLHNPDTRQRLYVTLTQDGYLYFCHNCMFKGFDRIKVVTQKQVDMILNPVTTEEGEEEDVKLPDDFSISYPFPEHMYKWLQEYIPNWSLEGHIERGTIGYSRKFNQIIFPIYNHKTEIVGWQGRNFDTNKTKYFNVFGKKKNIWYPPMSPALSLSRECEEEDLTEYHDELGKVVVIVEDIISAIKVNHLVPAVAILGSHISTGMAYNIVKNTGANSIVLWLDSDKIDKAIEYSRLFGPIVEHVLVVYTERDPKEYNTVEINEALACGRIHADDRSRRAYVEILQSETNTNGITWNYEDEYFTCRCNPDEEF